MDPDHSNRPPAGAVVLVVLDMVIIRRMGVVITGRISAGKPPFAAKPLLYPARPWPYKAAIMMFLPLLRRIIPPAL
jgi:hypothetical protein